MRIHGGEDRDAYRDRVVRIELHVHLCKRRTSSKELNWGFYCVVDIINGKQPKFLYLRVHEIKIRVDLGLPGVVK